MSETARPIITVDARVLTTFQAFFQQNKLVAEEVHYRRNEALLDDDTSPFYLEARADDSFVDDPGGIILHYDHATCPLTLPAGRRMMLGPRAGMIEEITMTYPLEPLPWDAMQQAVMAQVAALDAAGWKRSTGYFTSQRQVKPVLEPQDFLQASGPKWAQVGYWEQCDTPWIKAYLEVQHYNSSSADSFIPPADLSEPLDEFAEDRLLLLLRFEVEFESPLAKDLEELAQRRRLAVNGDPMARINGAVWLDDPDWRPEGWVGQVLK